MKYKLYVIFGFCLVFILTILIVHEKDGPQTTLLINSIKSEIYSSNTHHHISSLQHPSIPIVEPTQTAFIDAKLLNESGPIKYTLSQSLLYDMKLAGDKVPEKINIPVDISDIYFSVKTSSLYTDRLELIMLTWIQTVNNEQITFVTDKKTNLSNAFTDRGYKIYDAPHCGLGHTPASLCCKTGLEYEYYYQAIAAGKKFNWLCHIDDDQYFNVWKLKKMLTKYNPEEPWYIGKSHHGATPLKTVQARRFTEIKKYKWKFNTGNVYCLSKQMMTEVEKYLRLDHFQRTCEKTERIDDVTIAIVIVSLLGHDPTEEKQMWSHLEVLEELPKTESLKMISFGYGHMEGTHRGHWNSSINLPNPKFHYNNDPSRFMSYHCMMYPTIKWCQ